MKTVFLHVDLDAFFASVEQLDNPEYRGKPVIVGGLPGDRRSVVSTCSYEARKYGVHSAMPIAKAYQLCPNGIYVQGRHKRYHEKSNEVMAILKNYSPDVQQMSIDEAFVDLSGTERLFGPPEETAKRLKAEVKEKTGLTISVGMAKNKYLAKIASGVSKPDGFYKIEEGSEEEFMLRLPLKDVWGLGTKTLERLNNAGIRTTKQLHDCSLQLLSSMFGQCTAQFLYDSVRGLEEKNFDKPAKSHSISNEKTFSFDLTDSYIIETELMQLSTEVFFKLLDEKSNSKTVFVKIRYEDFTTITVQDTSASLLSSSDDLFNRAKNLLNKKYECGRGIRLLGVGVQNVEEDKQLQQELFDFDNNKKKSTVEKTVFEIQKKDPTSTVIKARLLIKNILFCFIFCLCATNLNSQEADTKNELDLKKILPPLPALQKEPPKSLFQYTKDNKNIEFLAEGWYQTKIGGGLSFLSNNKNFSFKTTGFIFEQKIDLSLWFLLNKHWYFETVFQDDFKKSTIAAGYYGDGYLKHARIGNNGISFPTTYDISSLGAGNIQSPGIMFSFAGEKWQTDFALRYDMLKTCEKTYTGMNEINEKEIDISSWEKGRRFIIPEISNDKIEGIYVQDKDGTYADSYGRIYKKLNSSQYAVKQNQNLLYLATQSTGAVAICFDDDNSLNETIAALGNFNNENTFLGELKNTFKKNGIDDIEKFINIKNFPDDFIITIDKTKSALIIFNPPFFSPFVLADYYKAGTSIYEDAVIISKSAKKTLSDYNVILSKDDAVFTETEYVKSSATYAILFKSDNKNQNYFLAENRYPLIEIIPEIYFQTNENLDAKKIDASIMLRSFSKVTSYDIGTNALSESVRVYKNGILDESATYNIKTGKIEFTKKPTEFDNIKIIWQEHDKTSDTGAINAALGFKYNLNKNSFFNLTAETLYSFNPKKKFTTLDEDMIANVKLATMYEYKNNNLNFSNKLSTSMSITDVTNTKQILSMDETESKTIYLSSECAEILNDDLIPTINCKQAPTLNNDNKKSFSYFKIEKDNGITGYAIETELSLSEKDDWAAYDINLGNSSSALASAKKFSIALRNTKEYVDDKTDFDIYLQLGNSFDKKNYIEYNVNLPTWRISKNNITDLDNENVSSSFILNPEKDKLSWQTVTVDISDFDRTMLTQYSDARIIIVKNGSNKTESEICLNVGPYEIIDASFFYQANNSLDIFSYSIIDSDAPLTEIFNSSSTNYSEQIKISFLESSNIENCASISKYISEFDLSNYNTLSMQIQFEKFNSIDETPNIILTFDRLKNSFLFDTALSLEIQKSTVYEISKKEEYKTVSINLDEKKVYINGKHIPTAKIFYNEKISPTHIKISFVYDSILENQVNKIQTVKINNIYMEDAEKSFYLENKSKFNYKKNGSIVRAKNFDFISDFNTELSSTEKFVFTNNDFSVDAKGDISTTLLGIKFGIASSVNTQNENIFSASGHNIATTTSNPVFKYVTITEQYNMNSDEEIAEKSNSLNISIPFKYLPINIKTSAIANISSNVLTQKMNSDINISVPGKNFSYKLSGKLNATQIENNFSSIQFNHQKYFYDYATLSGFQFANNFDNAYKRTQSINITQTFNIPKINFSPEISLQGENIFSSTTNHSLEQKNSFEITLPFKIKNNTFSFAWKKSSKENQIDVESQGHIDDTKLYFKNLSKQKMLIKTAPFADFFSSSIYDLIDSTNDTNDSLAYSTTYTISWKRPTAKNPYVNFFVPNSIKLISARDLTNNLNSNTSDITQFKATVGFTSINTFGKLSKLKLFKFYQQDEMMQSYSVNLKFTDATKSFDAYSISGYSGFTIFITNKNSISNVNDFQIAGKEKWNAKTTFSWKRPAKSSPATNLLLKIFPKLKKETLQLARKNVLSNQISNSGTLVNSTAISHQLETKFGKYVTVQADTSLTFSIDENKKFSLQPLATITAKIAF